jgi:hypothetical protein
VSPVLVLTQCALTFVLNCVALIASQFAETMCPYERVTPIALQGILQNYAAGGGHYRANNLLCNSLAASRLLCNAVTIDDVT